MDKYPDTLIFWTLLIMGVAGLATGHLLWSKRPQ